MNTFIITLFVIAVVILIRGFVFFVGRAATLRREQLEEDAYMERWSTWAEQTKVGP